MIEIVQIEGEAELLPLKYCPDCGMVYRDDEEQTAPRVCEINGAGQELAPIYAFYGGKT